MKKIIALPLACVLLAGCAKNKTLDEAIQDYNQKNGIEPSADTVDPVSLSVSDGQEGQKIETYFYYFTVNSSKVTSDYGTYSAKEGNQLVVVNMTLEDILEEPIQMSDLEFQIQWGEEEDGFALSVLYDEEGNPLDTLNSSQFPTRFALENGEPYTGEIVFEVPEDAEDFDFCTADSFSDTSIEPGVYFVRLQLQK